MTTTKSGGPVATLNTKIPYSLKLLLEAYATETNQAQVQVVIAALEAYLEKHNVTGAGQPGTASPQNQKEEEFEMLFEAPGISVYADSGKIFIEDAQEKLEHPDTPENRETLIRQAREIVAEWEAGR